MDVPFDSEPELSAERFEVRKGKIPPFVVPIPENGDVPEEYPAFLVEFRGVPRARPGRVEEFADDEGIGVFRLVSYFPELFEDAFGKEFHGGLG